MSAAQKSQPKQASETGSLKLPEIEKGLTTLWAEAVPGGRESNVTRVCTMSVIVPLPDKSLLDTALDAARAASQQHPLRAIFLITEPAEKPDIKGQISGYCQMSLEGDLEVCCEEIVLTAIGDAADELPSAASELLVADLPVVVWWLAQLELDKPVTEKLVTAADYLIVDSRTFTDSVSEFRRLIASLRRHPQTSAGDLNWSRLEPWRERTADVFDDQVARTYINQIDSLSIDYAADGNPNPAQALLFAGWFGSRMGWSCTGGSGDVGGGRFSSRVDSAAMRDINLEVNPVKGKRLDPGELAAVRCSGAGGKFSFTLTRVEGQPQIQVDAQADGMRPIHELTTFDLLPLGRLLAQEIEQFGPGSLFSEALNSGLACMDRPAQAR